MRAFGLPALAVAALGLTSIATPSFAGSPYYGPMGEPMTAEEADMAYDGMMHPDMMAPQPQGRGHFSCSYEERRTRLQRKACGATKSGY